jgi:hypothetical protein
MQETNISKSKTGLDRRTLIRGVAVAGASGLIASAQDKTMKHATVAAVPVLARQLL